MKLFYSLFAIILLSACGNKKAAIVEEIKKVKKELAVAKMNQGWYHSAGTHLMQYETAPKSVAHIYKEAFESDKEYLKGADPEVLKSSKKLDSVALIWEVKTILYSSRIDSLELELKKY
jgi:Na+/phosphate symporter